MVKDGALSTHPVVTTINIRALDYAMAMGNVLMGLNLMRMYLFIYPLLNSVFRPATLVI